MVSAGAKLRATDIPTGLWTDYTPVWAASGTQPVLNNGSLVGRWVRVGDLVVCIGKLLAGTTTTYGTGTYTISLPVTSNNFIGGNGVIGSAWIRDSSSGDYQGQLIDVGTAFAMRPAASTFGGNSQWGATAPMTMANGDFVSWYATYEAA